MPNTIDAAGLQVKSVTEIVAELTVAMQAIYGSDINVDSNSPDGQLINLYAQSVADTLELLLDIYNTFSVDSSYGVLLDQRVALNGITRREGTYTTTPVSITVNQALTLTGLDALETDPTAQVFTVKDNANNQFFLETTQVIASPGTASYTFRAVDLGAVEVVPNTITNQVTTVLGVTGVNNPTTTGTVVGVPEETDSQLKIRHAQSFALAATGPADSVEAALAALPDVTDAYVVENVQNTEVNTVPPHCIWCIVRGGTDADIGQAIYAKKGIGCDMKGSSTEVITRPNGTSFVAKWDVAISEDLYIEFTINPKIAGQSFDTTLIKQQLADALVYKLGQNPTVGDVITAMATIAPNAYLTDVGVSDDGISFFDIVTPTTAQYYFVTDPSRIDIST
jgi:uncharacterized phage protein gp47/JayE